MVSSTSNYFGKSAGYRLPGGRAPLAMPRPFTGGAGFSPLPSPEGSGTAPDSPSAVDSGCGAAGFGAAAVGAFFAPGLRAPGAIPSPLTSGSAAVEAGSVAVEAGSVAVDAGSAGAGADGAAFLAPGRRAPAAMPRPLTSGLGFADWA